MQNNETAKTASARNSFIWPILTIFVLVFFIVVMALFVFSRTREYGQVVTVGRESFIVEVADTVAEREVGLGGRESIGQNQGMLFDFKTDDIWKIWMLKMQFPIDIAWLDSSGKVVFIKNNATPDSFPNTFIPDVKSRYVLEVKAGTFERTGLRIGDSVRL